MGQTQIENPRQADIEQFAGSASGVPGYFELFYNGVTVIEYRFTNPFDALYWLTIRATKDELEYERECVFVNLHKRRTLETGFSSDPAGTYSTIFHS